jgi:hypothetical protein
MYPLAAEHVVVYRDSATFCAWPFTGGLWQFADGELCAGFIRAPCDYANPETLGHHRIECLAGELVLMRSRDGGLTWPRESLTSVFSRPAFDAVTDASDVANTSPHRYDPRADGYLLISGYGAPTAKRPQGVYVIVSTDRGQSWTAPVRVPSWLRGARFTFAESRPSYVVRPDGMLLLCGSASREEQKDGYGPGTAPVIWGSWNGGASWGLLSEVPVSPAGPIAIMPYPLFLDNGELALAVRRQYDTYNAYTQLYVSADGGRTWALRSRVNDWGAPANLVQLGDGRLVCVYGYRQEQPGIRARVSADRGRTWGEELIVRPGGGSWDLGYPRTLLRPDGALLTVYYFNEASDPVQQDGGVRHIAATIWRV